MLKGEGPLTSVFDPKDFVVEEPLVMFFVRNYVGDVYAAVRECWNMGDPAKRRPRFNLVLARSSDQIVGHSGRSNGFPVPATTVKGDGDSSVLPPKKASKRIMWASECPTGSVGRRIRCGI